MPQVSGLISLLFDSEHLKEAVKLFLAAGAPFSLPPFMGEGAGDGGLWRGRFGF
jgi:hypothetical protein